MNKVFKVIWSKTKNCYVVASELAKTHTKAPKSSIISRTLVAGVLACIIGASIVAPVYADGVVSAPGVGIANLSETATNYDGSGAIGYDSIAIGDAKAAGAGSVAVGSQALTTGTNSIAIGTYATATGDGTTREEIDAILSNNKAIRDALNDARAGYTQSQAEYDREKEIFDGQNEAVARVNHANELINGYQQEIDNTLQPNADTANTNYTNAKNAYDTLYNDLQGRLERIKYIDFSLYANGSEAGYDIPTMATNLKSDTEAGTSFNMPVSFYENYIVNYIKAEGDLRENNIIANESGMSDRISSNKVLISVTPNDTYAVNFIKMGLANSNLLDSMLLPASISNGYNVNIYYDDDGNSSFSTNSNYSPINSFTFATLTSASNWVYNCANTYSKIIGTDNSASGSLYSYASNEILNDSKYNSLVSSLNNRKVDYINGFTNLMNSWANANLISSSDAQSAISRYNTFIDNQYNGIKACYDIAHYQYLYEQAKSTYGVNSPEALNYLAQKEQALSIYNSIPRSNLYTTTNGGYGGGSYGTYRDSNLGEVVSLKLANWYKENIYDVKDATNVALREVREGLDEQLVNLQEELNTATQAKNTADQALANKQQQINQAQPSQEDLDAAAQAEQTAQDLAQKEAKLQADEQALEEAKANLQNLETISTGGESAIAIGGNAVTTGLNGIGIGTDALVTGEEAIGIGKNSVASGKQSIAIGTNNSVSKANSIVIGTNNGVTGVNSIAIGNNNVISGQNSVAIGNNLNVSEDNVVLLGTRRVTGVVDGQSATDAATVGQTFELVAGSGMTVEEDGVNAIGQKKYKLNSTATGGSTYVSGDNISIVDDVVSAVGLIKYDGDDKSSASLEGTRGTKLTNLKTASLTQTSTDAVIGAQLWATNKNIEGFANDIRTNTTNITNMNTAVTNALSSVAAISTAVDTVNDVKADISLNNLSDTGRQVIASAAANAVQEYMRQNGGNGGALGNNNTNLLGGINTLSASRPMGFGLMANPLGNSNDDIIVSNNDDMDNGNDISMEVQAALDDKANISLDNINDAGISVIRDAVADDLSLKADKDSVYTKDETDGLLDAKADLTYVNSALDLKADKDSVYSKSETDDLLGTKADITYVDEGLDAKADKSAVYTKEETDSFLDAKADKSALDAKANADGSNIDADAWSKALATGQVLPNDTGLVNGGTVFNSMMAVAQSNPVQAGEDTIFIGKQEKYDAVKAIDISNSKGEARVMTGVIANPQDMSSAANVGYVNAVGESIMGNINGRFSEVNEKISDVGANAAAMSALVPMTPDGDEKWALSAAVGHYDSSTASAVGLFYKPSDKVIVNVKGTVGSDKNMLAGGVTVALDKGSTPGVSKAQMVKTINAQAERIAKLEQVVNQLAQGKAQQ